MTNVAEYLGCNFCKWGKPLKSLILTTPCRKYISVHILLMLVHTAPPNTLVPDKCKSRFTINSDVSKCPLNDFRFAVLTRSHSRSLLTTTNQSERVHAKRVLNLKTQRKLMMDVYQ